MFDLAVSSKRFSRIHALANEVAYHTGSSTALLYMNETLFLDIENVADLESFAWHTRDAEKLLVAIDISFRRRCAYSRIEVLFPLICRCLAFLASTFDGPGKKGRI